MSPVHTALFLFAHQDDEFGVYEQLLEHSRRGDRIICAYLTDGGNQMERRNMESLRVLRRLSVAHEDVLFAGGLLGIPDGRLLAHLSTARDWLTRCFEIYAPIAVYVPAWEGGHPDHDCLHALGVLVAHESGTEGLVRQFPLYNGYRCKGPFFRVFAPLPANGAVESRAIPLRHKIRFLRHCLSYPSQSLTWLGLFPFVMLDYVLNGVQRLQPVSKERLSRRPHEGRLYYEHRGFATWEQVMEQLSPHI